ncbi:MAG: L,D-transpeptidase [Firmicutes bacterium]|nr:L,D-transpeptidase [Bacillota bacterium]
MRNGKLIITALVLCMMVLGLIILESFEIRPGGSGSEVLREAVSGTGADGTLQEGASGSDGSIDSSVGDEDADGIGKDANEAHIPVFEFDLKYTKYLVEAPYEYEANGETRRFKFEEMVRAIEPAREAFESGMVAYVDNYKNRNGNAPYRNGKSTDDFGGTRSASAPGYFNSDGSGDFRYIADGTLVIVENENEKFSEVKIVGETDGSSYFVPQHYVSTDDPLTALEKIIVVDRAEQNIAAFEKVPELVIEPVSSADILGIYKASTETVDSLGNEDDDVDNKDEAAEAEIADMVNVDVMECAADGLTEGAMPVAFPGGRAEWKIVSYSLATTGKSGKYHQPTPLGYYYAVEKKPKFYYLKDGTNDIEGYAPYAIRFTAGAYVHGVATAYKYTADGVRVDPGIHEFSKSIGTVPLSHKCVRNYTSHAKFLYDWYEHGKTIVIVIE